MSKLTLMSASRSVLEMSHEEAREYFLKPQSYFTEPLPPFISFDKLLKKIAEQDRDKLRELIEKKRRDIRESSNVNFIFYHNQDGKYAWRPFQLIHPLLYVNLVNIITEESHWKQIKEIFSDFHERAPNIKPLALPRESYQRRIRDRGAEIQHWIEEVEQETLRLAQKYQHLYYADIAKFYPSIYTHTIAWAIHGKEEAKKNKDNKNLLGNLIDWRIQDMQEGQTNGIPIGNTVINLIAEILLRYADTLIQNKAKDLYPNLDFTILRYRDDYRIFVNREEDGERLLKIISEVLRDLGLYLNDQKTSGPYSPIEGAFKPDKIAWLKRQRKYDDLQKELLTIHQHSLDFPNGGSLIKALTKVLKRIEQDRHRGKKLTSICRDPEGCISILTDISFRNPRVFHLGISIISQLLDYMLKNSQHDTVKMIVQEIGKG